MLAQITDSNGPQVLSWLIGFVAIVATLNLVAGFANSLKSLLGKKPDNYTQFESLNLRITTVENKTTNVEMSLLQKMAESKVEIAAIKESVGTLTLTMSNIENKLDRWIEGELAETRRQLAAAKSPAARRTR